MARTDALPPAERVYDLVLQNFEAAESSQERPVHIINVDVVSPFIETFMPFKSISTV